MYKHPSIFVSFFNESSTWSRSNSSFLSYLKLVDDTFQFNYGMLPEKYSLGVVI